MASKGHGNVLGIALAAIAVTGCVHLGKRPDQPDQSDRSDAQEKCTVVPQANAFLVALLGAVTGGKADTGGLENGAVIECPSTGAERPAPAKAPAKGSAPAPAPASVG